MRKFSFYHIRDDYIEFLRTVDDRVPVNKAELRPYVGIVLQVADINYYVPLTPPKEKHKHMKNGFDFRKIDGGKLGAMNFNNMVPVPDVALTEVIIGNITDEQYKRLLRNQYQALKVDWENIQRTAKQLYDLVCKGDTELNGYQRIVKRRCCNFQLLEVKQLEYLKGL